MYVSNITEISPSELYMYRRLVEVSVDLIFSGDIGNVDEYFSLVAESSAEEQLLSFHTDPLALAADLCNKVVSRDDQLLYEKYRTELLKRIGGARANTLKHPIQNNAKS